ncbi:hypothetical protein OKW96_20190 [Sphingobacterium sp. KU25419]|nr:hypothetical protein OKW96_20190 [Sphingobacterium sp. KU25419]
MINMDLRQAERKVQLKNDFSIEHDPYLQLLFSISSPDANPNIGTYYSNHMRGIDLCFQRIGLIAYLPSIGVKSLHE